MPPANCLREIFLCPTRSGNFFSAAISLPQAASSPLHKKRDKVCLQLTMCVRERGDGHCKKGIQAADSAAHLVSVTAAGVVSKIT